MNLRFHSMACFKCFDTPHLPSAGTALFSVQKSRVLHAPSMLKRRELIAAPLSKLLQYRMPESRLRGT